MRFIKVHMAEFDDMAMLEDLEHQSKIYKMQKAQVHEDMLSFCRQSNEPVAQDINRRLDVIKSQDRIYEDMLSFCRQSNDPVAQDINFRLDVLNSAWDVLCLDVDKLQLMYDQWREKRVAYNSLMYAKSTVSRLRAVE